MLSTKNWYFQIVLKKTLESLLVCKEIKPVNSKGNQPWIFHWKDWCWSSNTLFTWCKFSSVTQSCSSLCDPMDCSTPGLPVHHQLPEFTQTHSIELMMPSNHLILCGPLPLPPSIFPSITVFSNESALCIRWPKY